MYRGCPVDKKCESMDRHQRDSRIPPSCDSDISCRSSFIFSSSRIPLTRTLLGVDLRATPDSAITWHPSAAIYAAFRWYSRWSSFRSRSCFVFPWQRLGLGVLVFNVGLICAFFPDRRVAYQYAGITLVVAMLARRSGGMWLIATERFVEASLGVAVGLLLATIWPERRSWSS